MSLRGWTGKNSYPLTVNLAKLHRSSPFFSDEKHPARFLPLSPFEGGPGHCCRPHPFSVGFWSPPAVGRSLPRPTGRCAASPRQRLAGARSQSQANRAHKRLAIHKTPKETEKHCHFTLSIFHWDMLTDDFTDEWRGEGRGDIHRGRGMGAEMRDSRPQCRGPGIARVISQAYPKPHVPKSAKH